MTILEASGKQEPEVKEAPSGPLEEVRAMWPTCLCFSPQEAWTLNPQSPKILSVVKGSGHPSHTPLSQDGKAVRCALSAFSSARCSASSTPMRGMGVRWGVVRCTLPELSASLTPG